MPGDANNRQRSESLRRFIAQAPLEREPIVRFVSDVAAALPVGSRALDVGAGSAPYRELFDHCDYRTCDWENSPHEGARPHDYVAPIDKLPVGEGEFDAVLCTQVLEHVAEPAAAVAEMARVLKPGGSLLITVPLVNELHEEPYDYFRYTSHGLRHLCERAGLTVDSVEPSTGYFTTLAQMGRNAAMATGVELRLRDLPRRLLAGLIRLALAGLRRLDALDRRRVIPIGFLCRAHKPQ